MIHSKNVLFLLVAYEIYFIFLLITFFILIFLDSVLMVT